MKERQRQGAALSSGSQHCIEPCKTGTMSLTFLMLKYACFLLAVHGCALCGAINAAAVTPTQLVQSFVAATERGDAAAALKLVTDDFLCKTYRATTDSLAAAEARLQTKFPFPTKVRGLASSHP